jgi:hypothetical protein
MENNIIQMADSVPALIKNTHLNVNLSGWPAAISAIALFGSFVAVYAIKITNTASDCVTKGDPGPNEQSDN